MLDVDRREGSAAADQVGGFLGDHDDGCVDVAADEVGHYRGVDDAQSVDANDLELGIDDRIWLIWSLHFAGAERMVNSNRRRADMPVDFGIGLAAGTG